MRIRDAITSDRLWQDLIEIPRFFRRAPSMKWLLPKWWQTNQSLLSHIKASIFHSHLKKKKKFEAILLDALRYCEIYPTCQTTFLLTIGSEGTNKIKDAFSISRFSNLLLTANKSETDLHWPGHSVFHEIVIDGQIRLCQYHRMQRRGA